MALPYKLGDLVQVLPRVYGVSMRPPLSKALPIVLGALAALAVAALVVAPWGLSFRARVILVAMGTLAAVAGILPPEPSTPAHHPAPCSYRVHAGPAVVPIPASSARRLVWWLRQGPTRLHAARLRRLGAPLKALALLLGAGATGRVVVELIRLYPLPAQRLTEQAQVARVASAPPKRWRRVWRRIR